MLTKFKFQPGINRETTDYSNTGRWFDCNLVRFREGMPEKMGGWTRVYNAQSAMSGVCRKMYPWTALNGNRYTALPTTSNFYVDNDSTIIDITPFRRTLTLGASPIATTNGQTYIEITDPNHGCAPGDFVVISGATAVGGIAASSINATLEISFIISSSVYRVNVSGTASSTTTGGGSAVVVSYLIKSATDDEAVSTGWGGGVWGGGATPNYYSAVTNPVTTDTATNTTVLGIPKTTITITTPTSHGAAIGDWLVLTGVASTGGILAGNLQAAIQIATVPTGTTLTAQITGTATSSVTGGGTCAITIYGAAANTGWGFGPTDENTITGLWSVDNYGEDLVACNRQADIVQVIPSGGIATTHPSNPTIITVTQTGHGYSTGMGVTLSGVPSVGGIPAIDLNGTKTITVVNANSYTFVSDTAATSAATSSTVAYSYLSTIYYWDLGSSRLVSLSRLGSAYAKKFMPYTATEVMVSDVNRHVLAFGCNPFDPTLPVDKMIIRWSDSNDPTNWDASSTTNTSGELRCSTGSYIVTAIQNREEVLVWTDTALYALSYGTGNYTFGLQLVGTGFDIIGPNSKAVIGTAAYWMGLNNFYTYNGAVSPLPCSVREYVFSDINRSFGNNVYCSMDSGNNEIIWLYPSAASEENDRYVIYNYLDGIWYYGQLARSAWMDRGQYTFPRAFSTDGYIYNHESGYDDGSVNPALPLNSYIESSPIEISDGDRYMFVSRIVPDVSFRDTSLTLSPQPVVNFTLKTQDFPGATIYDGDTRATQRQSGATLMVNRFTKQVFTRLRARSVILRVGSDGISVGWRLGTPRLDIRQDGRK